MQGVLKKMRSSLGSADSEVVDYHLSIGDQLLHLNPYIGQRLAFTYTGNIYCDACGVKTKKSFSQGHCYPCMMRLARCDMCIMKPHTCHFDKGTCREPDWAQDHCMVPHYVYLSNTSGIKVGITRASQIPTRWIDQGAVQALPIMRVSNRLLSGLVEVALAEMVADKTNWRAMLKGQVEKQDLKAQAATMLPQINDKLDALRKQYGADTLQEVDADVTEIRYPVETYPAKISSFNLDKDPNVAGVLVGIKGQYLIFDNGVINMRKYTSYEITLA